MALKVIRLYLNKTQYVIGNQCSDMHALSSSINNSAKGILNLLEFSHMIFTYTIE